MKLKVLIAFIVVAAIAGGLAAVKTAQIRLLIARGKSFAPPPESVSSAIVHQEKWQSMLKAIGTVNAVQGVTITPDIPGTVRRIAFESGSMVKKGDLLVALDTSTEEAQLNAIEAQVALAKVTLERSAALRKQDIDSQSSLDTAEAALKQTQANADAIKATIEKKQIRAPFDGQLGIRMINLGQYLEAGKAIVSLQSLAPVYVNFSLPQQELARLQIGMKVRVTTDAFLGREFHGSLTAINPDLEQSTRSISLQATFENAEQQLRPGMFARAEVLLPEQKELLVIPATAILSAPYGDSVYIIESKTGTNSSAAGPALTVRQQFIRTGVGRGDFISVESGLKAGDKVVSAGAFKLRNGVSVVENNQSAPATSSNPRPADS